MAISTEKLLTLAQFQTGLTAAKNYTDAEVAEVQGAVDALETTVGTHGTDIEGMKSQIQALEEGTYDDTEVRGLISDNGEAIDAIEADYLKAADKTALQEQITANDGDIATNAAAIAAVKEDVDTFFANADLTESAKDTLKEIQEYINSDASAAAEMTASIKTNADAIDAIEADYLKAADKTALQEQITSNDGEISALQSGKADKATSLAGYGITNAYTKEEADAAFLSQDEVVINVATDEEVTAVCNTVFGTTAA